MLGSYPLLIRIIIGFLFAVSVSTTMSAPTIVTEKDAGRVIRIYAGDQLQIVLEANPSTGYTWEPISIDTKVLKPGDTDYVPDARDFGSGGRMMLRFKAVARGQTSLKLVYHRPFEKDTPPRNMFEIMVHVE
jgi:inhibitor of cysteine peptidase